MIAATALSATAWALSATAGAGWADAGATSAATDDRGAAAEAALHEAPGDADELARIGAFHRDAGDLDRASALYRQAAEAALQQGRVRFTRELSELFVARRDHTGLNETFGALLSADAGRDPGAHYLALVDYADGLAALGDEAAWQVFEQALALGGAGNPEALNRYLQHLVARGRYAECLELVDRLPEQRLARSALALRFRYECMKQLGLDVSEVEARMEQLRLRRTQAFGTAREDP